MFTLQKKRRITAESKRIDRAFFLRKDVLQIAQDLIGTKLCVIQNGQYCSGIIVETEAYRAPEDQASHAYQNRRTPRTSTMFAKGGTSYVYICYGIHRLFNVITGPKNIPHAVLIRAIEPLEGIETMLRRRNLKSLKKQVTAGPGCLTVAMGIGMLENGIDLCETKSHIWLEHRPEFNEKLIIEESKRIGVESAGKSALLPWRYTLKGNPYLSR